MTASTTARRSPTTSTCTDDRRLQRALESWQPNFLNWWESMGPTLPTEDVYLRTAVTVGREGWAHFGHVAMEDYRWGIFLAERDTDRRIALRRAQGRAGLAEGARRVPGRPAAADRHPGRHRAGRRSSSSATSARPRRRLYDLRNLFQVNVEEGRHLWAMVYLLHAYFGREGREEAEELLHRNSGSEDSPRILGAFNEETPDWLSFFMFTYFTDRDGKYQLGTLKESAFDPLSPHLRVHAQGGGAPHVRRHHRRRPGGGAHRAGSCASTTPTTSPRTAGSRSTSSRSTSTSTTRSRSTCSAAETSTNVANYYTAGLKGRWQEDRRKDDHVLTDDAMPRRRDASTATIGTTEVAALVGLNPDLRREYIADCQTGVKRWNRILEQAGLDPAAGAAARRRSTARSARSPASRRRRTGGSSSRRRVGSASTGQWLPTEADKTHVRSLMRPVYERGKIAAWIAPPKQGHQRQAVRLRLRAPRLRERRDDPVQRLRLPAGPADRGRRRAHGSR